MGTGCFKCRLRVKLDCFQCLGGVAVSRLGFGDALLSSGDLIIYIHRFGGELLFERVAELGFVRQAFSIALSLPEDLCAIRKLGLALLNVAVQLHLFGFVIL